MKIYNVQITNEALQDMKDIYDYIVTQLLVPEYALGQYNRIADAILTLQLFPERFKILESEPEATRNIRRMMVDNYSVFYIIDDTKFKNKKEKNQRVTLKKS